jgi:seryl-tRNA synthetase
MIEIQEIRKQPEKTQQNFNRRGFKISVEEILNLDREKLKNQTHLQELKCKKNALSKKVAELRKQKLEAAEYINQIRKINLIIDSVEQVFQEQEIQLQEILMQLPNLVDDDISEDNQVLKQFKSQPQFHFEPLSHMQLCKNHKLVDYEMAGKLMGSGYWIYRGLGAKLEWALLNFCLQENQKAGYEMVMLPPIAKECCGFGAGQFPKFRDEVYSIQGEDTFLIPTAETVLVNFHQNEMLREAKLPLKYTAYTPCFRKEVSKNPNEKGMIRGHQFNKVEMVQFATKEQSDEAFESLLSQAESLMQQLELHYRVVKLKASECSASMARTYDIEVWFPAEQMYKEVSSISNARTYQARRSNTRYKDEHGKIQYVHTLNASGLATSRLFAAILEQNQLEDGMVNIPKVLIPWVGTDKIE